jgi:hypothetical protein
MTATAIPDADDERVTYAKPSKHEPDFHVCTDCGTEYASHEKCPKCSRGFERRETVLVGSGEP